MDIRIKESIYISVEDKQYIVRTGTAGVVCSGHIVKFPDVSRTVTVGLPLDLCFELPQMFLVKRGPSDREVSLMGVVEALKKNNIPENVITEIMTKL